MTHSRSALYSAAAALSVTVMLLSLTSPAEAAPASGVDPATTTGYVIGQPDDQTDLDPGTIALCNAGFGDVSVKSYEAPVLGHIDLLCGDDASGYVHIRSRHERDWQILVDSYGGGNWDDFMEFALAQSVTAPADGYPLDIGAGKLCYSTPVQVFDGDGNLLATINPSIIVSGNNKKVISAVPTTDHVTTDCYRAT